MFFPCHWYQWLCSEVRERWPPILIVLWSNQKVDTLGRKPIWVPCTTEGRVQLAETAMQTGGILRMGALAPSREDWVRENVQANKPLPFFLPSLKLISLVWMCHLIQIQEDIWILSVSNLFFLCGVCYRNTPLIKRRCLSVARTCAWGQYLCCGVTILTNFLVLTCCFKIPVLWILTLWGLDSLLFLSSQLINRGMTAYLQSSLFWICSDKQGPAGLTPNSRWLFRSLCQRGMCLLMQ